MKASPRMIHMEKGALGRWRFTAPSGWDLVALLLAGACVAKEVPPILHAIASLF